MPWSFADLLGQEEIVRTLNREFELGRLASAYLLEGREGTGKLTLARGMAARLFCANPGPGGAACGNCRACGLLGRGNHPDYLELPREPAELRLGRFLERPGGEEIDHQPLLPFLRLKPVEGGWRAAVIPAAERLRTESANALLKTLEEPPGKTLILLTVDFRDGLPPTIASRCRRLATRPLPTETIRAELAARGVARGEAAAELAGMAEGSLGKALALAGDKTGALWRWLEGEAFARTGPQAAKRLADAWRAYGEDGRDAGKRRQNALAALELTAAALRRRLRREANPEGDAEALAALWRAGERIVLNVNPDVVLLSAAFEIMAALGRPDH
ncbi:MAG: DNA polymerase III subunit [Planctomycetota bacterium]|jgi:DNA polymerase-3 subunit delta'|nr:DNA polymerase III subunit [Planctomycetota bacterium]